MTAKAISVGGCIVLGGLHVIQQRVLHAARHDALIGLPTRRLWTTRAKRATGRPRGLVVLVIDTDGIKQVNDQHGHRAGDAIIAALARRLKTWNGTHGQVGRRGGDEFVAYMCATDVRTLARLLDELQSLPSAPVPYRQTMLTTSASIGAVLVDSLPSPTLHRAMRAADEAMYQAKHDGGGTWRLADGSGALATVQRPDNRCPASELNP